MPPPNRSKRTTMLIIPTTNQLTFCILYFLLYASVSAVQTVFFSYSASSITTIFKSSNTRRRAECFSVSASSEYTRVPTRMLQQTPLSHIHRSGSFCLRHLGEAPMGAIVCWTSRFVEDERSDLVM